MLVSVLDAVIRNQSRHLQHPAFNGKTLTLNRRYLKNTHKRNNTALFYAHRNPEWKETILYSNLAIVEV